MASRLDMLAHAAVGLALAARLAAAQATVTGVVFDSLFTKAPMRGATVVIPELARYAATNDRGRFRFESVPAGRYTMTFLHPRLDSLEIGAEILPITIPRSGVVTARLATPSSAAAVWMICRAVADTFPAMILGHVRDADDSSAVPRAAITAAWTEVFLRDDTVQRRTTRVAARARDDGAYVLCGLPKGRRVEVSASSDSGASDTAVVIASGDTLLRRVDFAIGGRRFPPAPPARAATPGVAARSDPSDFAGFETRRRAGKGRFLTEAEMARTGVKTLAAALLRLPPLVVGGTVRTPSRVVEMLLRAQGQPVGEIVETPLVRMRTRGRGSCAPAFFLNGLLWAPELPGGAQIEIETLFAVADVRGIEVYSPTAVPAIFNRYDGCGSVVIWTK